MALKPLSLFSNAVRSKEILTVLVRYGFDDLLQQLDVPTGWVRRLVSTEIPPGLNTWQRIRMACEELGPTFVKFAQLAGTRPDILPESLIMELRLLRDQVKPKSWELMEPVLLEELDDRPEVYFSEFEQEPIAAGSLGQIYRAQLKTTGEEVAVKLLKPNIRRQIRSDLDIIEWFARQLHEKLEDARGYDLPTLVDETRVAMLRELDFTNEARNADLFNNLNPDPDQVFAPKVFGDFTTRALMVTEFVRGKSPDRLKPEAEEGRRLAGNGGRSVFHQILISGFFHADPHTGNLLITEDGRICFLDWGIAGQLTREMRYFLADLLGAITEVDAEKVVRISVRAARTSRRIDRQGLEKDVSLLLRKYPNLNASANVLGRLMMELLYVLGSNGIYLTRDYTLLAKAVISFEESGKVLDPEFDIERVANPFFQQLSWERWNPRSVSQQIWWYLQGVVRQLQEFPGDLQRVLRRFEEEDININLHHRGIEEGVDLVNSATNRIALAIIIGATIIGSSMIITTGVEPLWFGYPVLGLVGYVFSAILGAWVTIDIVRHGRHR